MLNLHVDFAIIVSKSQQQHKHLFLLNELNMAAKEGREFSLTSDIAFLILSLLL